MKYNKINVDQVRAGSSLHTSLTAIKRKESSVDEGSNDDVNKLRLPSQVTDMPPHVLLQTLSRYRLSSTFQCESK